MSSETTIDSSAPPQRADARQLWRYMYAGAGASLASIGLARFVYTPLLPALLQAHWFSPADTVYLGAANLAGYLVGALAGRPLARRFDNVAVLRMMMVLVTLAFFACALPLSVAWFFAWRLLSGIAGGVIMVLVAASILPHVPPARRGLAGGAIFLGAGIGIAASGTLVPLLLDQGLSVTWIGLGVLSLLLTVSGWFCWPPSAERLPAGKTGAATVPTASVRPVIVFYAVYGLLALGFVPVMSFLVDYVARGLGAGAHTGASFWVIYGMGAIVGPVLYGALADRYGSAATLRGVLAVQAIVTAVLVLTDNLLLIGVLSFILGTFPPGVVPLALARVARAVPDNAGAQGLVWTRATTVFAAFQAAAGYGYSALFNLSGGSHQLLYWLGAGAMALALLVDVAGSRRARLPA
ncbi:MFS transporter [Bordetella genomosp. 1]|uniref:MFS transporter n=1 Tax=Bordetella genomosp. 1 TaxID=1395607 RepID=A0A261S6V2_9BORD|nr:YbfB/YjiJ family MFS transporter [Bordetella genomosp. 1]OZI32895.1 MFS transporter [Bordetella genomosp. 1]